jgi:hypothetical protein
MQQVDDDAICYTLGVSYTLERYFCRLHAWKIDFNKKQKRYLLFEKKDHHHADMGDIRSLDAVCHGRPRVFDPAAQSHGMVGTSRRLL